MRVTQRLLERPAMDSRRNESEGRRVHGGEHRTKSEDGGADKSLHQVFALFPVFFDGFEKHNDVADSTDTLS